jgi:predicted NBD/HSP70 family sugar kinase
MVVAVDISPTVTRLTALPAAGGDETSWRITFRTPKRAATFLTQLRRAKRRLRLPRPWCVVAAVPGMVDEKTGRVLHAQGLSWMTGTVLHDIFHKLWPAPVVLTTHARARAAALTTDQAISDSFLLVDFSDDVRGAAVTNGRVIESAIATFGELGHQPVNGCMRPCWCGAIGCINTLASRRGMVKSFSEVKHGRATWRSLLTHVKREGIPSWLEPTLVATGESITAAANVLGINHVVMTGAIAELGSSAVHCIAEVIRQRAIWSRFGQINVSACSPGIAAGLVARALDRVMLPDPIE